MTEAPIHQEEDPVALARDLQKEAKKTELVHHAQEYVFRTGGRKPSISNIFNLSTDFEMSIKEVKKILIEAEILESPIPKVRKDEMSVEERAFFKGLSRDRWDIDNITLSESDVSFITVASESKDLRKHELLKATFGTWGKVKEPEPTAAKMRSMVYLDAEVFKFLQEKQGSTLGDGILQSKEKFSTFLYGFLTPRVLEGKKSVYLDKELLKKINNSCQRYLQTPLGKLSKDRESWGLDFEDLEKGVKTLASVESVRRLPYFGKLNELVFKDLLEDKNP